MSLERRLKNANVLFKKFNIYENKRDRAFVKSVANGNETVPTLRIGSRSLVNPSLGQVLKVMADEVPHLVPAK